MIFRLDRADCVCCLADVVFDFFFGRSAMIFIVIAIISDMYGRYSLLKQRDCIPFYKQHVKQTTVAHNKAKRDKNVTRIL